MTDKKNQNEELSEFDNKEITPLEYSRLISQGKEKAYFNFEKRQLKASGNYHGEDNSKEISDGTREVESLEANQAALENQDSLLEDSEILSDTSDWEHIQNEFVDDEFSKDIFHKTIEEVMEEQVSSDKLEAKSLVSEHNDFEEVKENTENDVLDTEENQQSTQNNVVEAEVVIDNSVDEISQEVIEELEESEPLLVDELNEQTISNENSYNPRQSTFNKEVETDAEVEQKASKKKQTSLAKNKKPYKKIIIAVLILLCIGGIAGYQAYQSKQAAQIAQLKLSALEYQQKINDMYVTDATTGFLKADLTSEDINSLVNEVNTFGKENPEYQGDLLHQLQDIQGNYQQLQAVNSLFTEPVITNDQVGEGLLANSDTIELTPIEDPDNELEVALNKQLVNAKDQLATFEKATNSIADLYDGNQVKENITQANYETAKSAISAVNNQALVVELDKKLEAVNSLLTKKQQEAEAKEAERLAKEAQEQAAVDTSSANDNSIMSRNEEQIADTANSAWQWNSGVMEEVINTCLERGYIVNGGYILEPIRIENGEGYYNLYATAPSPLFDFLNQDNTPFYLVTINCKTGWFKGNGPY